MQVGDHLVTPRTGYKHHGIYVGSDKVIHYGGYNKGKKDGIVVVTTLSEFTQGNGYGFVRHKLRRFSLAQTVERAYSRLGERRYGLLFNNCEAFVTWCIWGVKISSQVSRNAIGLVLFLGMVVRFLA